ncbi:MAG: PSD1 domain-containing protein [Acidobacteria bacterium]|nr:PSD1 domain-containing protein [Acidobacteriota bacterium]
MRNWTALSLLALVTPLAASTEEAARKVLSARCWACHAQTAMGGLRLDSREAMVRGGASGAALAPGDAAASRIYRAITRTGGEVNAMPPGAAISTDETEVIRDWINAGAPWSDAQQHWAFQPLRAARGETIDSLIGAALRQRGLAANPRADKRTLLRRLYFDLTGLPPTEEQFARAEADGRPDWVGRLADELLGSPQFGVKWARHWLDVARYGEDDFSGTAVIPYENAWRYRDWVVEAFNAGMPYGRFLMAQLAGDLMNDDSLLAATGFLGAGPWYYGIAQPPQTRADERNDRIDAVTRGMLGVTVACARCHDHKYDPITARDYYALGGVFASTAYKEYPLVPAAEAEAWKKRKQESDEAEKALNRFLDEQAAELAERYAGSMAGYMMATVGGSTEGLEPKVVARWKEYLAKPEEFHPFLKRWFSGERTRAEAEAFERLLTEIREEKRGVDERNRKRVEEANRLAPKVTRTIVLPGGYRSEEDFNPGAYIPSESLERNRFVAYNRTFGEAGSPLKFSRELTPELLPVARRAEYERLRARREELKKALPPQYPYLMGAGEFEGHDLQLNKRGNPEDLGEVVPRQFPVALSRGQAIPLREGSGRLQLAQAVAGHPLAARVAANRVWMTLFGQGLVRTPSNFGRSGDRPVLPELVELLAARLDGGRASLKDLIGEIVRSEAYQRSSGPQAENEKSDTANRYWWRQNRRRLEAELLADATLAVSGELDAKLGGASSALTPAFTRRTLYARTGRFQQHETLSLFDLPSASVTCEQRVVTNVPLQKLYFLNSETLATRAEALAQRIAVEDAAGGVDKAYRLLFQRTPTAREREVALAFLAAGGEKRWALYAQVLLSSNEFAYVD